MLEVEERTILEIQRQLSIWTCERFELVECHDQPVVVAFYEFQSTSLGCRRTKSCCNDGDHLDLANFRRFA